MVKTRRPYVSPQLHPAPSLCSHFPSTSVQSHSHISCRRAHPSSSFTVHSHSFIWHHATWSQVSTPRISPQLYSAPSTQHMHQPQLHRTQSQLSLAPSTPSHSSPPPQFHRTPPPPYSHLLHHHAKLVPGHHHTRPGPHTHNDHFALSRCLNVQSQVAGFNLQPVMRLQSQFSQLKHK